MTQVVHTTKKGSDDVRQKQRSIERELKTHMQEQKLQQQALQRLIVQHLEEVTKGERKKGSMWQCAGGNGKKDVVKMIDHC